ncbi:hypothetical protein [Amycolatopsis sp. NPDC051071]|uniref:hypothetical protein n=1 Tax=Amycolatopsis sp. NPDC051071 TaxID=3154637 RepID=UPI0034429B32
MTHANDKLAYLKQRGRRAATVNLGIPAFNEIVGRIATLPARPHTGVQAASAVFSTGLAKR